MFFLSAAFAVVWDSRLNGEDDDSIWKTFIKKHLSLSQNLRLMFDYFRELIESYQKRIFSKLVNW